MILSSYAPATNVVAIPASINIVCEGDSITNGLGSSGNGYRYPDWMLATLPTSYNATMNDIGTSGIGSANVLSDYATRAGAAYVAGKFNVLVLMVGTNDGAATNWASSYRNIRSIVRKARATGYARILVGTLLSRSVPSGQTVTADNTFDASSLLLNTLIRNNWGDDLGCDGLVDFGAQAVFATAAVTTNATYYLQEGNQSLHPANGGYVVMGNVASAAVQSAVLAAGTQDAVCTWSVVDITSYILALSNGNRTFAWSSSGFSRATARTFYGVKSKKWAWETVANTASYSIHGLVNSLHDPYTSQYFLDDNPNCVGLSQDGTLKLNGSLVATLPAIANGDVIRHHVDVDAGRYWVRINGGQWNNSGSADPETGAGGIDISSIISAGSVANGGNGKLYPGAGVYQQGGQVTGCFTSSQMTWPVTAGFRCFGK